MKNLKNILMIVLISTVSQSLFAYKWQGEVKKHDIPATRATANCEPPRTSTDLAVNNVRTRIHTGGDMWWDLQGKPLYEIPAGGGAHALYAGSIWVGGLDANGQLKMAAQKFRQRGIDFWPGPLIVSGSEQGSVSNEICRYYDKHFEISRDMVTEFRGYRQCLEDPECDTDEMYPGYTTPDQIRNWPGNGREGGYAEVLAPYVDVNGDGYYNSDDGDFPYYEYIGEGITDDPECLRPRDRDPKIFGDYTLWWVYNDRGNIHTETGGSAIGMEFKSQAFAFMTNDELNDMTFYNYNITNRSTYTLYNTYFGVWTDADLGNPKDDYVGCDVLRGLGYSYNGDDNDESADGHIGYGEQPPAIGIDFFEGPYQDPTGVDKPTSFDTINGVKVLNCSKGDIMNGNINGLNFGDGIPDNERWGMRRFLYFNNYPDGNVNTRDPETALQHYNYITGYWLDNTPLSYGGTGHFSGGGDMNVPTDFMFPGRPTTDICGWGQGGNPKEDWSEETENNPAGDRRFVQSAGPFTLRPGAVNDITLGAVYARAASGGAWASVEAVQRADDKAQLLFENCFRVLSGPPAPDLTIIELDKKLIFHISNKPNTDNYLESYVEKDPSIICDSTLIPCDDHYRFQGYQVFQYRDGAVSISDRYNNALVRQVFQCDVKDDVSTLVNFTWSDDVAANIPQLEVQGANNGIQHTFVVTRDLFASGDNALVNNKEYYFSAIAYGYNSTMPYNQVIQESFNGLKTPYLAGRNNIKRYTAIPHKNVADGTILQSDYGTGVKITMVEGYGNGNNVIDLTQESIDKIMQGPPWNVHNERVYELGKGPIKVQIIDPLNVPDDSYQLKFEDVTSLPYFGIIGAASTIPLDKSNFVPFNYSIRNSAGEIIMNDLEIKYDDLNEQIFSKWGFSVVLNVDNFAAINKNSYQNGFLEASIEFKNSDMPWLFFFPDQDGQSYYNWIRSGRYQNRENLSSCGMDPSYDDARDSEYGGFLDPNQFFGNILSKTWAPYRLASYYRYGLAVPGTTNNGQKIHLSELLSSVDIVITSDQSKWTRCCVIETSENRWYDNPDNCNRPQEVSPAVNDNSIGNALKFGLRKSPSVGKDGKPLNDGTHGLGWFPGYAIDIRTGERLNMAFGEDSWLASENGQDMIWNPTGSYAASGSPLFGGKHFIWVFGNNQQSRNQADYDAPAYDEGAYMHSKLMEYERTGSSSELRKAWWAGMWCAIPMYDSSFEDPTVETPQYKLDNPYHFIKSDVKIRLRVATHYTKGIADLEVPGAINDNYPVFNFSTSDVKTIYNDNQAAKSALDEIRVVPNPYYGNSDYEHEQLDNYVRITNLPRRCIISIYNTSGTLIRKFEKDNNDTFLQWDLKNSSNISVSSGVYIIHILAYDGYNNADSKYVVGEKVIKWFGAMRPVDLNNF